MPHYAESADGVLIAYDVVHGADAAATTEPGDGSRNAPAPDAAGAPLPVLLVHGFAADAAITWEQTGWVRRLADSGRTVITLDLRGHGRSDKPVTPDAYRPQRLGADLAAVLRSAGVERADVVAYSLGSRVASAFVASARAMVNRVVIGGAGPRELFDAWDLDVVRALLIDDRTPQDPLIQAVLGSAIAAGADREAMLACVEGVAGATLELPSDVPALVVVGGDDPVPDGAEDLARQWRAHYVSIPGRDHISVLTSRAFKDEVIGFLDEPAGGDHAGGADEGGVHQDGARQEDALGGDAAL